MNSSASDANRASVSAVNLERLRRLTLSRATATYTHWVERSIGWGTLVWMVFWLVFYAIAASQVVIFNVKPAASGLLPVISSVLVALTVAYFVLTRRTPPVILNRQDLYRVGLAPLTPARVLAWEFAYSRGIGFFIGVLIGLIWVVDDSGFKGVSQIPALAYTAFAVTLFAGLSMVTNAPFYSFKVVGSRSTVPFIVIVAIALAIALVALDPPKVLFAIFCIYGLSGYCIYGWRRMKGKRTSVIATSTDDPDEQGLHR